MKNILTPEEVEHIRKVCATYQINKYSINPDGSIDVDGNVLMVGYGRTKITQLPIKFNRVNGLFSIKENGLTTLEGCPKYVDGNFICSFNKLTSLVGAPQYVGGTFSCNGNSLTTLDGCPKLTRNGYTFTGNGFATPVYTKLLYLNDNDENYVNINTFLKYYKQCDVWTNGVFNVDNFNDLMAEIEDGLE